jgi:hypothetical protein
LFHLFVSLISLISFIFFETDSAIQTALLMVGGIAFFRFLMEITGRKQSKMIEEAARACDLDYTTLAFYEGRVQKKVENYLHYLPNYTLLIVGGEGIPKQFFSDNDVLVQKACEYKGLVRFYYHDLFVVHFEFLES